ncbi:hypothetical protein ACL02O_13325 [Micromonospora sp. MS34]|uniref:hypothetical protein n=1 Tax=Micromonospora sp. MS34 TaxID=3385971 RepID=UPI0039A0E298
MGQHPEVPRPGRPEFGRRRDNGPAGDGLPPLWHWVYLLERRRDRLVAPMFGAQRLTVTARAGRDGVKAQVRDEAGNRTATGALPASRWCGGKRDPRPPGIDR